MNKRIKQTLDRLFIQNYQIIKDSSIDLLFEELLNENPKAFNINLGIISNLFDNEEIVNFKMAKKNKELVSAYKSVIKMDIDEKEISKGFILDIKKSLSEIKQKVSSEKKGFKNQIIFLEYDFAPFSYFCGFGEGDYPLLKKPEYFKYNHHEELYNGIGKIDYSSIWSKFIHFNDVLEELEIWDDIVETDFYKNIENSYRLKTNLILHDAFDNIGLEAFQGIDIKKPLSIYGNEHDCEAINIYAFE